MAQSPGTAHRVLVVDDEESIRDSCRKVLAKQNLLVELADDGKSGLARVSAFKPDVIILDLKMPGVNGMDMLREVQKSLPETVTIVITGYPSMESAVEAIKAGAYDFLPKPFTPLELRTIVNRALEKSALIRETARLEREKNRIRSNFVAMVSHQMKSPLAAAAECNEVLLKGLAGPLTDRQQALAERISARLRHLLNLVEDFLKLSRLEATGKPEGPQSVDLRDVVGRAWAATAQEMNSTTRRFELREPPGTPLPSVVMGDGSLLQELFSNLFSNSIKHTPEDGVIGVEFCRADGNQMIVKVFDTGDGIPAAEQPFVFDEFFRGKATKERNIPGTGLGLALVKRIVEAHRGSISLESQAGRGATFTLAFPRA